MPKSAGQAALDDLMRVAVTPTLKPLGFKKSAHTFRRAVADCVQIVNVQASQYSDATHVRFTINLGVFYPCVRAFSFFDPVSASGPRESECQLRTRIGPLFAKRDVWWDLAAGEPIEAVAGLVEPPLREHGVPWLKRMADFETARSVATSVDRIAFDFAAGKSAEAFMQLEQLVAKQPHWDTAKKWLEKLRAEDQR